MVIWGIDPGSATGAIVAVGEEECGTRPAPGNLISIIATMDMPTIKVGKNTFLNLEVLLAMTDALPYPDAIYMERLIPRGMMAKMMIGYGSLKMLGPIYDVQVNLVLNQHWQKWIGMQRGKGAPDLKAQSMELVGAHFDNPEMIEGPKKYFEHRADAAHIARYGLFDHWSNNNV